MSVLHPILLSILIVIPVSPCRSEAVYRPTHQEQQELRLLQERDNTKIKLALIAGIVSLGTAKILHSAGYVPDFNELIQTLMGK